MVHGYPLRAVTGFHLEHRAKWRRQGFHPGWVSRCRINLHVAPVSLSERRLRLQYTWNKDVTVLYKLQLRLKYSSEESNFLREQVNQSLQGAETKRLSDLCKFILGVSGEPGLDWGDLLFLAAWFPPAFFMRGQCIPFHGIRQVGENVDSQGHSSSHSPFSTVGVCSFPFWTQREGNVLWGVCNLRFLHLSGFYSSSSLEKILGGNHRCSCHLSFCFFSCYCLWDALLLLLTDFVNVSKIGRVVLS